MNTRSRRVIAAASRMTPEGPQVAVFGYSLRNITSLRHTAVLEPLLDASCYTHVLQ